MTFQFLAQLLCGGLVLLVGVTRVRILLVIDIIAHLSRLPLVGEWDDGLLHVPLGGQEVVLLVRIEGSTQALEN